MYLTDLMVQYGTAVVKMLVACTSNLGLRTEGTAVCQYSSTNIIKSM